MGAKNSRLLSQEGTSDSGANCSVAGEEDPGASLDSVPAGAGQPRKEDTLMLRRALGRWENEGGSEAGEAEALADAALATAAQKQ